MAALATAKKALIGGHLKVGLRTLVIVATETLRFKDGHQHAGKHKHVALLLFLIIVRSREHQLEVLGKIILSMCDRPAQVACISNRSIRQKQGAEV